LGVAAVPVAAALGPLRAAVDAAARERVARATWAGSPAWARRAGAGGQGRPAQRGPISRLAGRPYGLGHMTLDTLGKGTLGIPFIEKYVAHYKTPW